MNAAKKVTTILAKPLERILPKLRETIFSEKDRLVLHKYHDEAIADTANELMRKQALGIAGRFKLANDLLDDISKDTLIHPPRRPLRVCCDQSSLTSWSDFSSLTQNARGAFIFPPYTDGWPLNILKVPVIPPPDPGWLTPEEIKQSMLARMIRAFPHSGQLQLGVGCGTFYWGIKYPTLQRWFLGPMASVRANLSQLITLPPGLAFPTNISISTSVEIPTTALGGKITNLQPFVLIPGDDPVSGIVNLVGIASLTVYSPSGGFTCSLKFLDKVKNKFDAFGYFNPKSTLGVTVPLERSTTLLYAVITVELIVLLVGDPRPEPDGSVRGEDRFAGIDCTGGGYLQEDSGSTTINWFNASPMGLNAWLYYTFHEAGGGLIRIPYFQVKYPPAS